MVHDSCLILGAFENMIKSLDELLTKADVSETGYFVDVDLEYTDAIKKHDVSHYVSNL